jgi:peptidoglycan/xylan/chitin deacetylase (PgdA/CDA1 family)
MTPYMKSELTTGKVKTWYDPNIISYLETKKIPATIFVTGLFAETYPKEITQWSNDGLLIENHTYDHSAFNSPCFGLKILKTDQEKKDEITKTQNIIFNLTGKTPTLFRYPGLCFKTSDNKLVTNLGLTINNGNLNSGDPFNKNPNSIIKTVASKAKDSSVILMHLGGPNAPSSYKALEKLIPILKKKGFNFAQ